MSYRVICISRTTGSGGELVGEAVANKLAFRHCDQEVLELAAAKVGVPVDVVAAAEKRQSLVKRLIESMGLSPVVADPLAYLTRAPLEERYAYRLKPRPKDQAVSNDYRHLIREAIVEIAAAGDVVISAHAASMALASMPQVLRVFVTASDKRRAARFAVAGVAVSTADAEAAIAEDDDARREYFHRFYDVREELPTHYDLVINTDALTPEQAVTAIVSVARP